MAGLAVPVLFLAAVRYVTVPFETSLNLHYRQMIRLTFCLGTPGEVVKAIEFPGQTMGISDWLLGVHIHSSVTISPERYSREGLRSTKQLLELLLGTFLK